MKKLLIVTLTGAFAIASLSCQTSYDAYGNPRQSVDPVVAVAGAAAAGLLAYSIGRDSNNDNHHRPHYYNRSPYYDNHHRPQHYHCSPYYYDY